MLKSGVCKMKYHIIPKLQINAAYVSAFNSFEEAYDAAKKLAKEYLTSVMVMELIGTYDINVEWKPS